MTSVQFTADTKQSDSPAKAFNSNAAHTNTKHNLEANRGELRFNMHNKITIVEYDDFVKKFLPFIEIKRPRPNVFKGIATPMNEADMYKTLVSTVSFFDMACRATHVVYVVAARRDQRGHMRLYAPPRL